ncbi:RNA-binding domain-containing [Pyrrhoderma noxium]|uniref:RNA-binding domain-containing n=1 Tax=Pyrrhoderma noxium TaxID=2282107 RepID=A0A286U6T4_9AGAM|nr:RNA-binding domain-containing [Pyrrhoderma noxium]
MDVDMKIKDEDKSMSRGDLNGRERDKERDRRDNRDSRDRDRDRRERSRDRGGRRRNDHWEPDRRKRRSRTRSRSPRRRSISPRRRARRSHSRSIRSRSRSRSRDRKYDTFSRSLGGPINADPEEALEWSKQSKRENRVYVGNLSYDVRYRDLMEFMRGAGEVLFAEVLVTPTGVSKGCGIVEFATHEDAQRAIRELSEVPLLGRPVFIREDRETEARFGASPVPGGAQVPGNQLYVGNLPYQAGWQDLKDLFRTAGNIVRADINIGVDGRAKGSGTVIFETAKDAQQAISMYHGYEWYGRTLEVREDRYAGLSGSGSFRGGFRGGPRGFRGGLRGAGFRGGHRDAPGGSGSAFHGSGGYGGGNYGGNYDAEPSQQIMVRNLPYSTANEDLVELFETTGTVELAEILFDGTRSKGSGIVQFSQVSEAETAIAKFQLYMYGGRPLDVRYNDRWHTFAPTAARGGTVAPIQSDVAM